MLYCNDELVKINDPEYEYLKNEFAKIRKMKNPIRIKTTQKTEINKTGYVEAVPAHAWPLKATVINKDGQTETWIYTDNTPSLQDGRLTFKRSFVITHGLLTLDPIKETDKAYYILKLSGLLNSGLFEIEDFDKKNTEEIQKIGSNAAVEYFICNKYSPIYNDHKCIRSLASSWGVTNVDTMHIDTVRKNLLDKVNAGQRNYATTKRGVEEFVKEVNGDDPFSEYRTLIQLAIDRKVIEWSDKDKGWYLTDQDTKQLVQPLVFVSPIQISQKQNILLDYVRINANIFSLIKEVLESSENKDETQDSDKETGGSDDSDKIIMKARRNGIKTKGKTIEEISKELAELESKE